MKEKGSVTQIRHNADGQYEIAFVHRDLTPLAALLKHWQPKIHAFYTDLIADLMEHDPSLKPADVDTAFAAMTFNFGPNAATYEHMDHQNYAAGFCVVTSLGDYDASRGGHLFLRELGLVVEFPVGASILLPSAVIAHGNTSIGKNEYRASVTSYTAAGNVRWRDQLYKVQDNMTAAEKRTFRALQMPRRTAAVERLSKIDELGEDQKQFSLRTPRGAP